MAWFCFHFALFDLLVGIVALVIGLSIYKEILSTQMYTPLKSDLINNINMDHMHISLPFASFTISACTRPMIFWAICYCFKGPGYLCGSPIKITSSACPSTLSCYPTSQNVFAPDTSFYTQSNRYSRKRAIGFEDKRLSSRSKCHL